MKRGYSVDDYRRLVNHIRSILPDAAIHNDVIVGFPGETTQQFQRTADLLVELEFDKVHIARYSPRPGTVSARRMLDDVPDVEKRRRFHELEAIQKEISIKKMSTWLGKDVEVLVEDQHKDRWRGRSPHGKLVFFNAPGELTGRMVNVRINHTGPWSMSGYLEQQQMSASLEPGRIPLRLSTL
jgi:tRNA-2-methylthio-N6-dimethylallyladenosine synthase